MKIKIEVDIEDVIQDMFEEEDSDFSSRIKESIINESTRRVTAVFKPQIDSLLVAQLNPMIEKRLNLIIKHTVDNLIELGDLKVRGETVKITDYIKDQFNRSNGWRAPEETISKIANNFGKEMKVQYNNHFAMSIVKNMSEQGLLNDDVAKALLAPPKSNG